MSSKSWAKRNVVLITCSALVVGIHWGWWKMQQNSNLVDPKDRKELPIFVMYKDLKARLIGNNMSQANDGLEDKD